MDRCQELYVIRDIVAEEFGPVYQCKNEAVAVRRYLQIIKESCVNPADYKLYRVGYITDETAELIPELYCVPQKNEYNFDDDEVVRDEKSS